MLTGHLVGTAGLPNPGSLGRFGVMMFFVHTSFVLMGSLERLEARGLTGRRLATAFYIRRFFRIYPLAATVILMIFVFRIPAVPLGNWQWPGAKVFLSNLGLIQNLTHTRDMLGPLWSLPLEVQMYLFLPFLWAGLAGGGYRSIPMWLFSVFAALATSGISSVFNVVLFSPCFVAGVVAYDLRRSCSWRMPAWTFPVIVLAAILAFKPFDDLPLWIGNGKTLRAWVLSLALGVAIAFSKDGALKSSHSVTRWIAEHSYGIYLIHIPVIWFVFRLLGASPLALRVTVLTAGTVGIPVLLHSAIEKPCIALGAALARRAASMPSVPAVKPGLEASPAA